MTAATWPTTARSRSSSTRSATYDRVLEPGRGGRGADHPRLRDPHPQRLRDRCGYAAGPRGRRARTCSTRTTRSPSSGSASATARWSRSDAGCGCGCCTPPATPTPTCPSRCEADGEPVAVFTGGSLLYGSTGRPGPARPRPHADAGPRPVALGPPAGRRAARRHRGLPDARLRQLLLGHPERGGTASTIGQEQRANPALTADEQRYVEELLAGLDACPAYYAHMAPANAAGPQSAGSVPARREADPSELRRRIAAGEWVVDLRSRVGVRRRARRRHAQLRPRRAVRHLPGLAAALGHPADPARRDRRGTSPRRSASWSASASTGRRRMATGKPEEWAGEQPLAQLPQATFAGPGRSAAPRPRRRSSSTCGATRNAPRSTSTGSVHIPIHDLLARLDEIPAGAVWVHCAGGYRAGVVAALLDARGSTSWPSTTPSARRTRGRPAHDGQEGA